MGENGQRADVLTMPGDPSEVARYKEAMQRMGQDILTLRHQVALITLLIFKFYVASLILMGIR